MKILEEFRKMKCVNHIIYIVDEYDDWANNTAVELLDKKRKKASEMKSFDSQLLLIVAK